MPELLSKRPLMWLVKGVLTSEVENEKVTFSNWFICDDINISYGEFFCSANEFFRQ